MFNVATSDLTVFSKTEAAELMGKEVTEAGVYRVVSEGRGLPDVTFLGAVNNIDLSGDVIDCDDDVDDDLAEGFDFEIEEGILYSGINYDCAPAEYICVGDF